MQIYETFFTAVSSLVVCPTAPAASNSRIAKLCLLSMFCRGSSLNHHLKSSTRQEAFIAGLTSFIFFMDSLSTIQCLKIVLEFLFHFLAVYGEKASVVLVKHGCYQFLSHLFTYLEIFLDFSLFHLSTLLPKLCS